MNPTTEQLIAWITKHFPPDAKSWAQATDEIPEMIRVLKELLGIGLQPSLSVRGSASPSEWNKRGAAAIEHLYDRLSNGERTQFIAHFDFLQKAFTGPVDQTAPM